MEGPWGEGLGYYTSGFSQPPIKVKAIYNRNNPIVLGEPTLRFRDRGAAGGFAQAARRWHMLEQYRPEQPRPGDVGDQHPRGSGDAGAHPARPAVQRGQSSRPDSRQA